MDTGILIVIRHRRRHLSSAGKDVGSPRSHEGLASTGSGYEIRCRGRIPRRLIQGEIVKKSLLIAAFATVLSAESAYVDCSTSALAGMWVVNMTGLAKRGENRMKSAVICNLLPIDKKGNINGGRDLRFRYQPGVDQENLW